MWGLLMIQIRDSKESELTVFCEQELGLGTRDYIAPYSIEKYRTEFAREGILYKSLLSYTDPPVGFMILALEPDGKSLSA